MLLTASLDRPPRRKPQANAALGGLSRHLVVNARVPDEIHMNEWPLIMTTCGFPLPGLKPHGIQGVRHLVVGAVLCFVLLEKIPNVFDHLIANLYSHALLGDGLKQSPQHDLAPVPVLVAPEIRGDASELI